MAEGSFLDDSGFLVHDGREKTINDPIHGHYTLPYYCMEIIDTPQFQRLRDLKQLGSTYMVYPGASHNRFEHCLGVSHLARKMMNHLRAKQPELDITDRDVKLVTLAGLCHDIGHGPFSHSFEEWLHQRRPDAHWHHEEMSMRMIEYAIDDNNIDLPSADLKMLQDLIVGSKRNNYSEKRFLFDIVANMRNSIDVDKFDYLARDCMFSGIKSSYDYSRLIKHCRVINDEICFHQKEVYNIYEMFHTRYSMHKTVYTHRVGKAIEYMISDALTLADPYLNISAAVDDVSEFTLLSDSIVKQIETSKDKQLDPAKAIIKKIRKRDLYKFADEVLIPVEKWDRFSRVTAEDIRGYNSNLKEDDIIVNFVTLNYAMKEKNPVDNTHFFTKWNEDSYFTIPKENVSLLIPDQFSEKYMRIFVRNPEKRWEAQEAFRKFLAKIDCAPSPAHSLPTVSPTKHMSILDQSFAKKLTFN